MFRCTEAKCAGAKAVVRPDVVFFGEPLPARYFPLSDQDMAECDLLLVFGTSLAVAPVNGLVAKTKNNVPRVYVNRYARRLSYSDLDAFPVKCSLLVRALPSLLLFCSVSHLF